MPYDSNKNELEILEYWKKNKSFEKSIESRPMDKPYVFYDGPPFATGLPHYGHIVASLMKDVVPRYWTMKGYRIERVWGWDCHGLPIENIVEKELGTKSKKEIEEMGVAKFNELCRSKVLSYVSEWEKTIHRLGRWVDMENAYRTMDLPYMESVWWVFKQLWDKDLVYKGYKSMHICPRCETTLSQQEVSEGYKDIKDLSVVAKFKTKNAKEKLDLDGDVYVLAWTTTPWTLPGNVLLAVGKTIEYSIVKFEDAYYIIAKDRLMEKFDGKEFEVIRQVVGKDLVGLGYEPLFPYYSETENGFRVIAADFVSADDGTGVVHIAPAFGEDDYEIGKREKTGWVQHVSMDGRFKDEVLDFVGKQVKPIENSQETDIEIIKYLAKKELLFSKKKFEHSYPHCWRCDTPLLNYATTSWFVSVTKIKTQALKLAKNINWSPEHIKDGRFGKWMEGARDWSISRQRFWASVMPVWHCEACDEYRVFGAVADLEKASGKKVTDLHKHVVDEIVVPCEKCSGDTHRIPDVLDTWFDSGSMPYAQVHYPFENEKKFEESFPAEFIAEGQDQTRAWFYYLHVIATGVKKSPAFKNVIVNGIVLAEDGKKMSKKLQNYPDPNGILEKYGADALRYYLVTSPVMHAENLSFSEEGVREMYNKVVNMLWNVFTFYQIFADDNSESVTKSSENVLDKWILVRLNELVRNVTEYMDKYELAEASRPIMDFVLDLSQWYVRRSRDRFKGDDEENKQNALATLREVLLTLSKVMAPFTPFIAEKIYQEISEGDESVHLENWPAYAKATTGKPGREDIMKDMEAARQVCSLGLAARKKAGIPVRQPLNLLMIDMGDFNLDNFELIELIKSEVNVKDIKPVFRGFDISKSRERGILKIKESGLEKIYSIDMDGSNLVLLDLEITEELKKEGLVREIIRAVNQKRKEQKLTRHDRVVIEYSTDDELLGSVFVDFADEIKKHVLADELREGGGDDVKIDGKELTLGVNKV